MCYKGIALCLQKKKKKERKIKEKKKTNMTVLSTLLQLLI